MWVVESVTKEEPVVGSAPVSSTRYEYRGGLFDARERRFAGFRSVKQIQRVPQPGSTHDLIDGSTTLSLFHQTRPLEGRKEHEIVYMDNGHNGIFADHWYDWSVESKPAAWGHERHFPELMSRTEIDASSKPGDKWKSAYCPADGGRGGDYRAKKTLFQYDECGNVTREVNEEVTRLPDTGDSGEARKLRAVDRTWGRQVENEDCDLEQRVCRGICDRLQRQVVEEGLNERFAYDEKGNQIEATKIGDRELTTARTYDAMGLLTEITDPRGMRTRINFGDRKIHPTAWLVDYGGKNHWTLIKYHPLFGTVTTYQDPNLVETKYGYDVFGRLIWVAEPGQGPYQPTRRYRYVIDDPFWRRSRVETHHFEPEWPLEGSYRKEAAFYDSHGRKLRRQVVREVNGELSVVALDAVDYASDGRVNREYAPAALATFSHPDTATLFWPLGSAFPHTQLFRDDFGRVVYRRFADDTWNYTGRQTAWVTEECDALNSASDSEGKCVETEVDALGRVRFRRTYVATSGVPHLEEERTYFLSGELQAVGFSQSEDGTEVATSYEYDDFNRVIAKTDPSSGIWTYEYDDNGNLTKVDDPKPDRHVLMDYDSLNRMEKWREREGEDEQHFRNVKYGTFTYDGDGPFSTGRLSNVFRKVREDNDLVFQYTRNIEAYTERGDVAVASTVLRTDNVIHAYKQENEYDAVGRMTKTSLPAPGLNGHENLVYGYSASDDIVRIGSNRVSPYVDGVEYDERQRVTKLEYGNGVVDRIAFYDADGTAGGTGGPGFGGQIFQIRSRHEERGEDLRRLDYSGYTVNSQVSEVVDGLTGQIFQNAEYDDAGRIKEWSTGGDPFQYRYDGLGRILEKEGAIYTYSSEKPFHIDNYNGAPLHYDANGNIDQLPGGRTLTYNAEGNLASVVNNGAKTQYYYDDTGKRRTKIAPNGEVTMYFDGFDVEGDTVERHIKLNGRLIVTSRTALDDTAVAELAPVVHDSPWPPPTWLVVAISGLALGLIGMRIRSGLPIAFPVPGRVLVCGAGLIAVGGTCDLSFDDTKRFYHLDHLGSPQVLTNEDGELAEEPTRHRPYGAIDTGPTDSEGAFGFTGHRKTENHGLSYFGARFYVPELGVFASLDPEEQFANPYSYSNGDPLNRVDPTGGRSESVETRWISPRQYKQAQARVANELENADGAELQLKIIGILAAPITVMSSVLGAVSTAISVHDNLAEGDIFGASLSVAANQIPAKTVTRAALKSVGTDALDAVNDSVRESIFSGSPSTGASPFSPASGAFVQSPESSSPSAFETEEDPFDEGDQMFDVNADDDDSVTEAQIPTDISIPSYEGGLSDEEGTCSETCSEY